MEFNGIKIFDHSLYVKDYLRSKNLVGHNDIINGCLRFWQCGTSFTSIADNTYTADGFKYNKNGTMVHDITRDTDVPSNDLLYSLKIDCTTADADIDAGNYAIIEHKIEGYNFKKYVNKYGTLSFWVKATKTGIYCLSVKSYGLDATYIVEYTINNSNTWEYKTITIPFDYSGGTWDYTNGIGLYITWVLATGSNFHGTANTWNYSDKQGTSNQINACDNTDNNFWLTGIKFELGQIATPFIANDFAIEFERCRRYYEKSYDFNVAPGTVDEDGKVFIVDPKSNGRCHVFMKTTKRAKPTCKIYSPATGAIDKYRDETSGVDVTGNTMNQGFNIFTANFNSHGDTIENCTFHWTADARL